MAKQDFNDRVKREMIALQTEWKFDQEERERVEIGVSLKIAHQDYLDKVKQRSVDNYNKAVAHQELVDKQTKLLEERRASVRGWEREKAKLMQYKENGVAVAEDEDRLEEVQQQLDEAKKHYDSTVRLFSTNALVLESEAKTDFEKQMYKNHADSIMEEDPFRGVYVNSNQFNYTLEVQAVKAEAKARVEQAGVKMDEKRLQEKAVQRAKMAEKKEEIAGLEQKADRNGREERKLQSLKKDLVKMEEMERRQKIKERYEATVTEHWSRVGREKELFALANKSYQDKRVQFNDMDWIMDGNKTLAFQKREMGVNEKIQDLMYKREALQAERSALLEMQEKKIKLSFGEKWALRRFEAKTKKLEKNIDKITKKEMDYCKKEWKSGKMTDDHYWARLRQVKSSDPEEFNKFMYDSNNERAVSGQLLQCDPGTYCKGAFEEAYRQKHSENHMWDRRWGIVEVNRMSLKTHTGVNYKEQLLPGVGKQGQYTKELDRGKVFEENREKTTAVRVDLSEHLTPRPVERKLSKTADGVKKIEAKEVEKD
jgi:hypothetical protein